MTTKISSLIRRIVAVATILTAFVFTSSAQKLTVLSVPVDTLKARAAADGERYNALLTRFIAADATLTVEEAALVYYGYYDAPIERKAPSLSENMKAFDSLKARNYEAAYALFSKQIEDNPIAGRNIYGAYICAKNLGRDEEAIRLYIKSLLLAKVIMASGDGKSFETALQVNEVSDEYFLLYDTYSDHQKSENGHSR